MGRLLCGCALLAVGVVVLAALGGIAAAAPNPTKEAFQRGRTAYDRGDYQQAIELLRPLLYPSIELSREEDVVLAHRLLGLSYFFVSRSREAEQEVISLLNLRPNYALDPIVDPPPAVRFFEEVRHRQAERLETLKQREQAAEERERRLAEQKRAEEHARADRVYVDRVVEHHSRLIAALPFGIGQLQNGQRKKAIAFGVAETLFAAASLGSYFSLEYLYPISPTTLRREYRPEDKTTATTLLGLQLGAGAAFWATVAWGIVDAQLHFSSEVVRQSRERTQKPSLTLLPTPAGVLFAGTF